MTRRSKIWLGVAVSFVALNFAGGVIAAAQGELLPHAAVHAGLMLLGAYVVWQLTPERYKRRRRRVGAAVMPVLSGEFTERLMQLEQAIDAVAIEVERIGEGQRSITRFFAEKGTVRAPGEGEGAAEVRRPL